VSFFFCRGDLREAILRSKSGFAFEPKAARELAHVRLGEKSSERSEEYPTLSAKRRSIRFCGCLFVLVWIFVEWDSKGGSWRGAGCTPQPPWLFSQKKESHSLRQNDGP